MITPVAMTAATAVRSVARVQKLLRKYAERFGATPFEATLLITVFAVCQLVSGPVLGRTSDRVHAAWEIARELVKKGGDLGLLGATIPEEYGGLGLDQTTGVVIAEYIGRAGGFERDRGPF